MTKLVIIVLAFLFPPTVVWGIGAFAAWDAYWNLASVDSRVGYLILSAAAYVPGFPLAMAALEAFTE